MLYSIQFEILDFVWVLVFAIAVFAFGAMSNFRWIRREVLVLFLLCKMAFGLTYTIMSTISDVEFDASGYFRAGSEYALLLRNLVKGESLDYLLTNPFWGLGGSSTDRFESLSGLFLVLAGGSYLGATIIACILGAIGQLFLFRFFRERFPLVRSIYFLPVLFHPSLMLWSGMLLKDSIGIFALGWAVFSMHRLLVGRQVSSVFLLLISVYVIFLFRSFIFVPLIGFVLFLVWDLIIWPRTRGDMLGDFWRFLYAMMAGVGSLLACWFVVNRYGSDLVEDRKMALQIYSQIEAGSTFENVDLSFSLDGVLALGIGIVNSLLRPFPWDVAKPLQAAASLENIVVLIFVLLGLTAYFRRFSAVQRSEFAGVFWGMLVLVMVSAAGVGLFASNSGTISRYRIPMIPFLVAVPGLALGMADSFKRMTRFRKSVLT